MNRENERLERITRMEEIYDKSYEAVQKLLEAAEQYLSIKSELKELKAYYTGLQWMEDFDADRAGEIPKEMKRGILTEDAIYNLLIDEVRVISLLKYNIGVIVEEE